jgi:hypothetical protein
MKHGLFFAALVATLITAAPNATMGASTLDLTDIWWNSSQSGMGYQIVQNDDLLFVTFYVFGPDSKPLWYVAQLSHADNMTFSGDVYFGNGPFFGSATYDPSTVTRTKVGTASFTADDISKGTLNYSITQIVSGTTLTATNSVVITRFTLKSENFSGNYLGWYVVKRSGCSQTDLNGTISEAPGITVTHEGSDIKLMITPFNPYGEACQFAGRYVQDGKMGRVSGNFACDGQYFGKFVFSEMEHRRNGFSLHVEAQDQHYGCTIHAAMSAMLPLL